MAANLAGDEAGPEARLRSASRHGVDHVELAVQDLDRSLDFYRGVLGFRPAAPPAPAAEGTVWLDAGSSSVPGASVLLALTPATAEPAAEGGWRADDLQKGFRHLGFKVGDVPAYAERLRDAGTTFTLEPLEAVGAVRLAFFTDPDGTLLEIIDGHLTYDRVWSSELAAAEAAAATARDPQAGPVLDHVAVTVESLDAALALYRDELGYELIGGLSHAFYDQRGFEIDYLQAGPSIVELFTFTDAPKDASPWVADPVVPGIRGLGVAVPRALHPVDRQDLLRSSGAEPVLRDAAGLIDPDGIALQLRRAEL